jgi:hypothetical protein
MDILETITHEPFRTYSQDEFAHTCGSMWMEITTRTLDGSVVTIKDQSEYRKACHVFNRDWNAENDGTVSSMRVIRVLPGSFDGKNGYQREVTQRYACAVRHKYLAAESADENY